MSGGTTDEQTLLEAALDELTRELDVPLAKILELDATGEILRVRAGLGWPEGVINGEPIAAHETTQAGMTLAAGDTIIFDNVGGTRRLNDPLLQRCGVVSSVCTPIVAGDWQYGVLSVHATDPRRFTWAEAGVVKRVASLLAWTLAARRGQRGDSTP
jgi:GAF domain-containing protein